MATDYYAVLGVRRDAGPDEIKKAFRRLARELHPDVNPDPKTQERFKEINAAYEVLSDPQKKQVYDLGGDPLSAAGGGGGGAGASGPASATSATSWTRSSGSRSSAGRAHAPAAARTR